MARAVGGRSGGEQVRHHTDSAAGSIWTVVGGDVDGTKIFKAWTCPPDDDPLAGPALVVGGVCPNAETHLKIRARSISF